MMRKKKNNSAPTLTESRMMIGSNLNFAASEAYKLLRTNLMFSIPDDTSNCKIIGVTSALRGEGKSTTSVNIAYTMAQTDKRVLLIECDLRLPTVAKRLKLHRWPGVSNLLVGQCKGGNVLQKPENMGNLDVITAGDVPPNPAELLGSQQMKSMLKVLAKSYDVIIVDLPPVNVVSDALILCKQLSGMVLVVREDYCEKNEIAEAVRQLRFADAKLLGFVVTCSKTQQKNYGKYGKYGKYGNYYGTGSATAEEAEPKEND